MVNLIYIRAAIRERTGQELFVQLFFKPQALV